MILVQDSWLTQILTHVSSTYLWTFIISVWQFSLLTRSMPGCTRKWPKNRWNTGRWTKSKRRLDGRERRTRCAHSFFPKITKNALISKFLGHFVIFRAQNQLTRPCTEWVKHPHLSRVKHTFTHAWVVEGVRLCNMTKYIIIGTHAVFTPLRPGVVVRVIRHKTSSVKVGG